MNKIFLNILILCLIVFSMCSSSDHRFYSMTNKQIDSILIHISKKKMTITERMNDYSEFFLGTPYSFTCVGDGPYALLETYPLVNFKETNCMAFCEHILALAISDSWDNFFNNLQHIRYKDGLIGMRTRNHYTMGDWLPENAWLLQDITRKVGGPYTQHLTRVISHLTFFKDKGIEDLRYVKADREITIDYIPSAYIKQVKTNLQVGDIGALIFANKSDIFSAHMWIVAEENGELLIRESSSSQNSTFDTAFDVWAEKIQQAKRYAGIALMRVQDELNQPGRVIVPWEIPKLKEKNKKQR